MQVWWSSALILSLRTCTTQSRRGRRTHRSTTCLDSPTSNAIYWATDSAIYKYNKWFLLCVSCRLLVTVEYVVLDVWINFIKKYFVTPEWEGRYTDKKFRTWYKSDGGYPLANLTALVIQLMVDLYFFLKMFIIALNRKI